MSKAEHKKLKAIQRKNRTYFTLKIKIKANEDGFDELMKQTAKFFEQLQKTYKTSIVYGFRDKTPNHALMPPKNIPDSLITFREFFLGAQPRTEDGHAWATAWIGHDKDSTEIIETMKFWSKLSNSWMFKKALQEKNTVRDYFLLWSTEKWTLPSYTRPPQKLSKHSPRKNTNLHSHGLSFVMITDAISVLLTLMLEEIRF